MLKESDIMTKVKICGLSRMEDIQCANRIQPDYIGMVFYEKSKRAVTMEQAASLKAALDTNIKAVGVFVNGGKIEVTHGDSPGKAGSHPPR